MTVNFQNIKPVADAGDNQAALVGDTVILDHYIDLIADVLTLYVLVELSRSLVDYYSGHSLRLTYIADAAIVFIIREVLIALFKHEVAPDMLYAHAAILFVLGAIRVSTVLASRRVTANE